MITPASQRKQSALRWKRSWGAAPQAGADPAKDSPLRAAVTLRQIVRISGGGERIRVRLTNEFGASALHVGAASIGIALPGGAMRDGSLRHLEFSGATTAVAPAGAPLVSDDVTLALDPLTEVVVSIYLPQGVENPTSHSIPTSCGWIIPGEAVEAATLAPEATPLPELTLLSALEVLPTGPAIGIVTVGDSITDGAGATPGMHHTWPELLADRFHHETDTAAYVSNGGISANRLLHSGHGEATLARFDRDVLITPGLDIVIVFQGINDIGFQYGPPGPDDPPGFFLGVNRGSFDGAHAIISGYQQLITRTHSLGAKVLGATLTPFKGAEFFSPEGEHVRQQVNTWIRTSGAFDAVLDFDAAWLDTATGQIKDGYHWGDFLHGSDLGYEALADSIDLSILLPDAGAIHI